MTINISHLEHLAKQASKERSALKTTYIWACIWALKQVGGIIGDPSSTLMDALNDAMEEIMS